MDNKQKEQLKKGLIFGGLGPFSVLSMWFIFVPPDKDKSATQQELNDSIPQTTTKQLAGNKLKAYELGDKSRQDEQTREEMGRLSDYLNSSTTPSGNEHAGAATSTAKIESPICRYEENDRLLNSFYMSDPNRQEHEALCSELDDLKRELTSKNENEDAEEKRQPILMEKSHQTTAKYLPQSSSTAATTNTFTPAKGKDTLETSATKQTSSTDSLPAMEVLVERKQMMSSFNQPMIDTDFVQQYGTKPRNMGFHLLMSVVTTMPRNTPNVMVDRTVTLKEDNSVALRLPETAQIQDLRISRQS